jgi:effector-binding domain-containing protein
MADPRGPSSKIELRLLEGHHTASVRETVARDDITEAMGQAFQAVREALEKQGVEAAGSLFARWHSFGDSVDMEAGVMVKTPIAPDGEVKPSELPGGPAAIAVHAGPYEGLSRTYDAVSAWLARTGRESNGGPWEIYLTDPSAEPDPAKWLTEIIYPLVPAPDSAAAT